jgi:hypothetical protein
MVHWLRNTDMEVQKSKIKLGDKTDGPNVAIAWLACFIFWRFHAQISAQRPAILRLFVAFLNLSQQITK